MNFMTHHGGGSARSENIYRIAQFCCIAVMSYGVLVSGLAREGDLKRNALGLFIAVYGVICALLNRFGAHVDHLVYREVHALQTHGK